MLARLQLDAKSDPLKNENKSETFCTEQRSMHLTCATTPVILHKGAIQDLYKGAQKGTPEIALNGAIQVALTLHLFMQLSMHKSVQYDSAKGDSSLGST